MGTTNSPLYPGGTADLAITIENPNDFPIVISAVAPGAERPTADPEHRNAGCRNTGVSVAERVHTVAWRIDEKGRGTFTLADGVRMTNRSDSACQGATFTIPLRVSGVSAP
jgi:hypothetical protein